MFPRLGNIRQKLERIYYAPQMRALLNGGTWCIDQSHWRDDSVEIRGWALPPDGDRASMMFTADGREFAHTEYPLPRADIGGLFWYVPEARQSGFICRTPAIQTRVSTRGEAVFQFVRRSTGEPLHPEQSYYDLPTLAETLPPAMNRRRVHGGDDEPSFRLEGYTNFRKLDGVLNRQFGRSYTDFAAILDWGCGCGRFTRYFQPLPIRKLVGADIDADNIRWCTENLSRGTFQAIPPYPPTPFAEASFDLLIGISIFTHLREKEQDLWLKELHRIATPGAILLMTVHGEASFCRSGIPVSYLPRWRRRGFLDAGANPDLDPVLADRDYYKNTFHTREYVLDHWGRYFTIRTIVPALVGNHQDLVVMGKP